MILALIKIGDDQHDWFDGECEFPVLPPVGSTIRVIDKNGNMQDLTVEKIVIEGVRPKLKAELKGMVGKQAITLFTTENFGTA